MKQLITITSILAAGTLGAWAADSYDGSFTWSGGTSITQSLWETETSWTIDGTTWGTGWTGPGTATNNTPNSWDNIYVSDATGTIDALEGWALRLSITNTDLTVGTLNKLQATGGAPDNHITIDVTSTLTISSFGGGGSDGGNSILTNYGVLNIAYNKNQGGNGFTSITLGETGYCNFTSTGSAYTAKVSEVSATLTNSGTKVVDTGNVGADGNAIVTRTLIDLDSNMTFATEATVSATLTNGLTNVSELTEVTSYDALLTATAGSYFVSITDSGLAISYVIPEPSMFGLLAGTLALGLAGTRRRRRCAK